MKTSGLGVEESRKMVLFTVMCMLVLAASQASAMGAGATTGFASEVYDIVVTKILQGPIGFVAGVAAVVYGALNAVKAQFLPAAAAIIGGGVLIKSDALVSSMGMMV